MASCITNRRNTAQNLLTDTVAEYVCAGVAALPSQTTLLWCAKCPHRMRSSKTRNLEYILQFHTTINWTFSERYLQIKSACWLGSNANLNFPHCLLCSSCFVRRCIPLTGFCLCQSFMMSALAHPHQRICVACQCPPSLAVEKHMIQLAVAGHLPMTSTSCDSWHFPSAWGSTGSPVPPQNAWDTHTHTPHRIRMTSRQMREICKLLTATHGTLEQSISFNIHRHASTSLQKKKTIHILQKLFGNPSRRTATGETDPSDCESEKGQQRSSTGSRPRKIPIRTRENHRPHRSHQSVTTRRPDAVVLTSSCLHRRTTCHSTTRRRRTNNTSQRSIPRKGRSTTQEKEEGQTAPPTGGMEEANSSEKGRRWRNQHHTRGESSAKQHHPKQQVGKTAPPKRRRLNNHFALIDFALL